eukprot:4726392-Prymnesium_polylepis.1
MRSASPSAARSSIPGPLRPLPAAPGGPRLRRCCLTGVTGDVTSSTHSDPIGLPIEVAAPMCADAEGNTRPCLLSRWHSKHCFLIFRPAVERGFHWRGKISGLAVCLFAENYGIGDRGPKIGDRAGGA